MDLSLMSILFSSEVKNAGFIGVQLIFDPKTASGVAMVESLNGDLDGLVKAVSASIGKRGNGNREEMFELFAKIVLESCKGRPDRLLKLSSFIKQTYEF